MPPSITHVARSLTVRLALAFLVVSLIGIALVGLLGQSRTRSEFDWLVAASDNERLAERLAELYQARGGWQGVSAEALALRPAREPEAPAWPEGDPALRDGLMPRVAIVDASGLVAVAGPGHRVGEAVAPLSATRALPVVVDDSLVGQLVIERPGPPGLNTLERTYVERVTRVLLQAGIGAAAIALGLSVVLSRALTRPLRALTAAATALGQGRLGEQVPATSSDEIGELARAFNRMSADLARGQQLRRQMMADIAHELRTPLSIVLGHAEALRDGVLPGSDETYDILHDEAQRLTRLVEDLRTLSLSDAGELALLRVPNDPCELAARTAQRHRAQASAQGVALRAEVEEGLGQVDVDPDRMAQVLDNLMVNALAHTPAGGEIVLSARRVGEPATSGGAPADNGRRAVRLSVRDSGSGLAPGELERVFERYYRADAPGRGLVDGSGLGLAIARSLVEAHGGRIWAESSPEGGACFHVQLAACAP